MSQSIRAVYSKGQLRPLDPVNLSEGQEVELVIVLDEANAVSSDERAYITEQLRAAHLLVEDWSDLDEEIEELLALGVTPLTEPAALPIGSRPTQALIDEDRAES